MIRYVEGDATAPAEGGLIVHVVNDIGAWGAGFVLALSKRWGEPERAYREWAKSKSDVTAGDFVLGGVQVIEVAPRTWVANMVAQSGIGQSQGIPLRYDALSTCLTQVAAHAQRLAAPIHMPRIGCGLAGGTWSRVGPIVQRTLDGIGVTVYDLPTRRFVR